MLRNQFKILILIGLIGLLIFSACTPGVTSTNSQPGAGPDQAQGGGEDPNMIEKTAAPGAPLNPVPVPAEPLGREQDAPPGGEPGGLGEQMEPQQLLNGKLIEYEDSHNKFRIQYPENFVFRRLPAEKLEQLEPKPEASFTITNPQLSEAEQAGIGPGDIEIRTYPAGQQNLENWLRSVKLLPAGEKAKPFKTDSASGFEVWASSMIAPGCSYFFLGSGWIYQLTPASLDGEAMLKTFVITR